MSVVLPVRIGDPWLAIGAEAVIEILGARCWFPVPDAPPIMPGVLAWHGRAIPVLDLAVVFGGRALRPGEARPRTVIAAAGGSTLAIPVDGVREVQPDAADPPVDLAAAVAAAAAALPEAHRGSAVAPQSMRRPGC